MKEINENTKESEKLKSGKLKTGRFFRKINTHEKQDKIHKEREDKKNKGRM
jgi:hypothetical protein